MTSTRRDFVKLTATAGAALALAARPLYGAGARMGTQERTRAGGVERAPQALRILILGGTGFTGPHQVRYAVARGHSVAVFNRGTREADLPTSVQHLRGDRNAPDGVAALRDSGPWDVVIDVPTTLPKWVRDAGQALQGRADHFVFVSTISTYESFSTAGMDESSPLARYTGEKDPYSLTQQEAGQHYGALKVLSEQEAERQFPGRTTIVRPGLIVGEGDTSDRFTYWPVRIARGGDVVVPGDGTDPVQVIDSRDLAELIIRLAEARATGVYNATGPRSPLTMAEMIAGVRAVLPGSLDVRFHWLPAEFLAEQQVRGWSGPESLPVWIPAREGNDGWGRVGIQRALDAGLTYRSLADTTQSVLEYFPSYQAGLDPERRARGMAAGLTEEKERQVLEAWRARGGR